MSFPSVGQMFHGRYRLDETLGQGGFATVFGAHDTAAQRRVALKILKRTHGEYPEEVVSRFTREVRIVANLRDPHTVTMFDFGESADGLLFMVFEHVPGQDLSQLLEHGRPLREHDALHIIAQVLHSLREAHRAGLLHRDIKPENIRIYPYGPDQLRVKVLDFGIARPSQSDGQNNITRPGELMGTPRYMSPEQLLEIELTPASDLYSVGLVAMELLLGRPAQHGNSWADQRERLSSGHVFNLPANLEISQQTRLAVAQMCARDAADRFQSADEVLAALGVSGPLDSGSFDQLPTLQARRPPEFESADHIEVATTRVRRPRAGKQRVSTRVLAGAAVALLAMLVIAANAAYQRLTPAPPEVVSHPPTPSRTRPVSLIKQAPDDPPPRAVDAGVGSADVDEPAKSEGCGIKRTPGVTEIRDVESLQSFRWMTYIPQGYDGRTARPVVFLFHDAAQQPEQLIRESRFDDIADEHGFVIVAPKDEMIFDGKGLWGSVWETESSLTRVLEIWSSAQTKLCVDTARVFAVGHASGGYAAERLGCSMPLTAVATNAHIRLPSDATCEPRPPVPFITLLGKADGYVPRDGSPNCADVKKFSWAQNTAQRRKLNGCGTKASTYLDDPSGRCETWECDHALVNCELEGGREWPGAAPRIWDQVTKRCAGSPSNFPMAATIWAFFAEQPSLPTRD